jgi:hypothetical protein
VGRLPGRNLSLKEKGSMSEEVTATDWREGKESEFPEVTGPLYPDLSGLGYRGSSGGPIRTSGNSQGLRSGTIPPGSETWNLE